MSRTKRNIVLLSLLFIYTLIYRFVVMKYLLDIGDSISASFMILFLALAIYFLGFKIDKNNALKRNIIVVTTLQIGAFFAISYILGFFFGFLKNAYSMALPTIFNNIFAPIIIIICVEFFRYVFINANKDSKEFLSLGVILLILFELFTSVKSFDITDAATVFEVTTASILPIIFKNLVLSYLTYHVGYRPTLIYRLVMDVYPFVLPYIPDLGDYITSMLGICMPILLFIFASRIIGSYYNLEEKVYYKKGIELADIRIIVFIVILVGLISGFFPIYTLGVGSNSMAPKINKGDAIIAHKVKEPKDVEIGDVIVYQTPEKKVIHRLVDIESRDGVTYYYTKGDANNGRDDIELQFQNILGVVDFRIPYIAYPSVWLTEYFETH